MHHPLRLSVLATAVLLAATLVAPTHFIRAQQSTIASMDLELAAALERGDHPAARRLLEGALSPELPVARDYTARPLLSRQSFDDLQILLTAGAGDARAAARINNLGVSLALRGWRYSADMCFGRAVSRDGRWIPVLEGGPRKQGLDESQFYVSTGVASAVGLNVRNLQRLAGKTPRARRTREEWPKILRSTLGEELQQFAELFPPLASATFQEMTSGGDILRAYYQLASLKGRVLRQIRQSTEQSRVAARRAQRERDGDAPPAAPTPLPPQAPGKKFDLAAEAARERALENRLQASGIHGREGREWWLYDPAYPIRPEGALRPDEAFVDFYLVDVTMNGSNIHRDYRGVVLGPTGGARSFSLGSAAQVDTTIAGLRTAMGGASTAPHRPTDERGLGLTRRANEELRSQALDSLVQLVWVTLRDMLPAGTTRIWLAPDGRLSEVPWQSLAVRSSDRHLVTLVDSPMGLLERRPPTTSNGRLLLVGAVDYGPPRAERSQVPPLAPLPGTLAELSAIRAIAKGEGLQTEELTGAGVTKSAIIKALPASIVHLATHGLFRLAGFRPRILAVGPWVVLDPELPVRSSPLVAAVAAPGMTSEAEFRRRLDDAVRATANKTAQADTNVVVQGALALSGANGARDPYVIDSTSFLTDLDFARFDLSDTDLVVLAACDLGQFDQVAFQGLASMQSAVILARARTVMSSLWRVPDAETAEFMRMFYENLLVRKLPKAEALRLTQRAMSVDSAGNPRSPFYWAGWTLTGEGW